MHKDREAAIAPLFGFILLFFAWGIGAVMNTGEVAYDKVRAQNAADILALAHADQMARDLNVMAMNNVGLTQMMVVGAVSFTVQEELLNIGVRVAAGTAHIAWSAAKRCPSWGHFAFICYSIHAGAMAGTLGAGADAAYIQIRYQPHQGVATASRLIDAFNRMNDYIYQSFPKRSGKLLRELADANRIDAFFVYPPCNPSGASDCTGQGDEGGDLPLSRNGFERLLAHTEMCQAAQSGSVGESRYNFRVHGFPDGRGPYTAGGSSSRPHLRDHVNHTAGFASLLPFYDGVMRGTDWLIRYPKPPYYDKRQRSDNNHFTELMNTNWSALCGAAGSVTAQVANLFLTMPDTYWIDGRSYGSVMASQIGFMSMDYEKLSRLVVVARARGGRFNPEDFEEREDPYNAYAQALTFNPQALDLYTSAWTSRLTPASYMDKATAVAEALTTKAENKQWFGLLARIIQRERSDNVWASVNFH
nr:Tad domain-containing protein [Rhizobium sp. L1K21]